MQPLTLFHVSEEPGIERFEPRAIAEGDEPLVWAIVASSLRFSIIRMRNAQPR